MKYVGVDIGKWKCRAAVMNPEGVLIDEFAFNNDHQGIEDLASKLTPEDRVVMESTGSVWTNLYDALDERNVPVVLANPLKTRATASARIKTDKVDARILAHLLRGDLVAECYVPPRLDHGLDAFSRKQVVDIPRVIDAVADDLRHPHILLCLIHQTWQHPDVVGVVGGDLHGDHLMGLGVDGEVKLHVLALLAVYPLHPAPGLVDLDAGGVDGYRDGLSRLPEAPVGAEVQAEDALPEAGVVSLWEGWYESV